MEYVVGFFVVASLLAGLMLRDRLGLPSAPRGERDDAATALPGGIAAEAIVQRLTQDGMSKGIASHQCRLELLVRHPHSGALATVSLAQQLDTAVLRYFAPGATIAVLVDPADSTQVAVSVPATRARATGRATLPAAGCRGIPDAVYLDPAERRIEGGVPGRAVLCCVEPDTPTHGVLCNTTFGLWVDASASGYATVITDRLTITELLCFPRGIEVPIVVDPASPTRVAIDCEAARVASMAMFVPSVEAFARAAAALEETGSVATVVALQATGSQHGVRYGCTLSVEPHGADAARTATRLAVKLAIPDLVALVPGSPVIVTRDVGAVDLDATARVRAHTALVDAGWTL